MATSFLLFKQKGINTVGGLVEFSPEGKYLRSSDAEIQEGQSFKTIWDCISAKT